MEKVEKEGLPTVPYKPEIDGIAAQAEQAKEVLTPDPIGARSDARRGQDRAVATLEDRVEQILQRYREARKISRLAQDPGRARSPSERKPGTAARRGRGQPRSPDGPDVPEAGGPAEGGPRGRSRRAAVEHLAGGRALLQQAEQTLDGVLKARDFCGKDQPERVRETQRLREAMGQYEAFESELRRDFAPGSWQDVAGNLAQARALLETFDRKTEEAAEAATPTAQKYLLGSRLLGQVPRSSRRPSSS